MPMIVLEGPDGGGKSTLFERLRPVFPDYEFLHSGGPIKSPYDLIGRMTASKANQVRDRHYCISEPIYGPLFGRPNLITAPVMKHFLSFRPLVIFCFAQTDELPPQEGEHDTPEHVAGITKNRQAIIDAYRRLAASQLPYLSCIYKWTNYEDVERLALQHEKGFF